MATTVSLNGSSYSIPAVGDSYGLSLTNYLIALSTGVLSKAGGTFTLTGEVNFGATYGLKTPYLKSQAANPSSSGIIRLGNNESIGFRNAANNADLLLKANASDLLEYNGIAIPTISSTDTLTNKTISGSSNTFSNIGYSALTLTGGIVNADISASAAIAYSKLAIADSDLTIAKTSGLQAALDAKAPLNSPTLVTPTLGVATATSLAMGEALNASSILDVASTTKGFLEPRMTQAQRDAIATPATGLQIYNTDSNKLNYYNGTSWSEVGSGSSGINYITDYDGSAIGLWTTYADAAATSPVDGTGGSPASTYAVSTDSSLRGASNFLWTHSAANRQGEGFSYNFIINPADKGKVLQCSFEYLVASGTYADDDLQFWIYDVTNATLIQPAPYKLKNSGIIEKFAFEFQTASNSTSYRLIGHVATSTATAYTIRFDNWNLGPQAKLYGSPITDWVSYTPTGTLSTNVTYTGYWRRSGDSMEVIARISFSGVNTQGAVTLNLPSGYTIDTTKTNAAPNVIFGSGRVYDSSTDQGYDSEVVYSSTTAVRMSRGDTTAGSAADTSSNRPITFAASDTVDFNFKIPIVGWSSSVVMSQDASTRVVSLTAYRSSPNLTITAGTPLEVIINTIETDGDTHGSLDTTTGRFTAKVPGWYRFSANAILTMGATAAGQIELFVKKNGSSAKLYGYYVLDSLANSKNYSVFITDKVYLNAGDYISLWATSTSQNVTFQSNSSSHVSSISIERISGPSQIAASEVVAGDWYKNGNTTYNANATRQQILINTANLDTHSMLSSNTVVIQTPGIYEIDAQAYFSGANIVSGGLYSVLVTKTTLGGTVLAGAESRASAAGAVTSCTTTGIRSLVTGDILYFAVSSNQNHSASTITVDGSTTFLTKISVRRLGGI